MRRSEERARRGERIDARVLDLCEPEVRHLHDDEAIFFFEEEVRRLDVAMDDSRRVPRRDAATGLHHEGNGDARLEHFDSSEQRAEILSAHARHDEIGSAGRLVDAVIDQREDVLVDEASGRVDLAVEPRTRLGGGRMCARHDEQRLHRDHAAIGRLRLEYRAHSARAELLSEDVLAAEHGTGRDGGCCLTRHRSRGDASLDLRCIPRGSPFSACSP
jgi:hypothetical protein